MKKNRLVILFLLVAMLISASITSCGNTDSGKNDATQTSASDTSSSDAETDTESGEFVDRQNVDDGLGNFDFGGSEFNIVLSTEQMVEPYFVESESGEVINDAVYKRTLSIEERFNVTLKHHDTGGNWNEVSEAVRKSVMAGDHAYDLAVAHTFIGLTDLMSSGYLYDWNKLPNVDMNKPWWNHSVVDELTIDGKLFTASSDYIYQRPMVIYFNKEMVSNYNLESPYDLVKSGKWTWSKLSEMASAVSGDLNGDGIFDQNDNYGYSHTLGWQTISVIHSQGMHLTSPDSNGYPRFEPYTSEKMATIFQNYYNLILNGNQSYMTKYESSQGAKNGYTPMFGEGHILFLHSNTELLQDFRDITLDFGMLPLPKYDESQDGYYSMADTQVLIVPYSIENPEMVGTIAEALAAESYKTVVPAVYEVTFASKYLRDEESYDMFNIIRSGLVYEFSWTYGEGNSMVYALPNLMQEKKTDISSYYASNVAAVEKKIQTIVDKILELQ